MNIYDIARLSGVSIATVSRVMNGNSGVSKKTRKKVMDIIHKESYTPNIFAQGLGLHTMHTIGILVPSISDMYMSRAVSFLEVQLREFGYDCILSCTGFDQQQREEHVQLLLSKHIDALIMVGSSYTGQGNVEDTNYIRAAAQQIPVFIANGIVQGDNIYCYISDDRKAVYTAVSAMINEGGKRKILFLTESYTHSARCKLEGYKKALSRANIPYDKNLVLHVPDDIHSVRDALLSNPSLHFEAVMACTDIIALGVIKYALERKLNIPSDLSIIGYNNTILTQCSEPELTSIDNRSDQLCHAIVHHLIALLSGSQNEPHHLTVNCELITRGTTDFNYV